MSRKYEFRLDREEKDLSKLLLTKRQWLTTLRWALFSLVCLVGLLVQDVLLYRQSYAGAMADIVPCLIFMIAVLQDAETGSLFALIASCLYQFSGSGPELYGIPLITAIAAFLVIFRQGYLRQGFFSLLICGAAGMLLYEMSLFAIALFLGETFPERAASMALMALRTLILVPVAYPLLRCIGKIGGETWKE